MGKGGPRLIKRGSGIWGRKNSQLTAVVTRNANPAPQIRADGAPSRGFMWWVLGQQLVLEPSSQPEEAHPAGEGSH